MARTRFAITSFPHRPFGEKTCGFQRKWEDVHKKIIMRLQNVVSFYELYADVSSTDYSLPTTHSVLDQWIVARTNELVGEVTKAMDVYEIDRAVRPLMDFVDDLSTWYIRRSRERFKEMMRTTKEMLYTTHHVLLTSPKW